MTRDLVVDRRRVFHSLAKVKTWNPVDDYTDRGAGPKQTQKLQEQAYPLSECMSCGCCLEACPQYLKIELTQRHDESDADFVARENAEFNKGFIGAHAISQAMLFNDNPLGDPLANERLDTLMGSGGIQMCGNAQNCVAVCPKEIPLTTSIAKAGRATTLHMLKQWFDR